MNENNIIKSGKEVLDDFFKNITTIDNIDVSIATCLMELYTKGKLTDKNVANELQIIRQQDDNEN